MLILAGTGNNGFAAFGTVPPDLCRRHHGLHVRCIFFPTVLQGIDCIGFSILEHFRLDPEGCFIIIVGVACLFFVPAGAALFVVFSLFLKVSIDCIHIAVHQLVDYLLVFGGTKHFIHSIIQLAVGKAAHFIHQDLAAGILTHDLQQFT